MIKEEIKILIDKAEVLLKEDPRSAVGAYLALYDKNKELLTTDNDLLFSVVSGLLTLIESRGWIKKR